MWCAHMPIFGQHNNKCKMYISFRYLQHQNSIICRMHIYNIVFGWLLVASYSQCICGMWRWLYIPSWGYHAILLQSSIYFCNKIYAISGYDWFGMTSSYSNDIPSRFLANIWGNQWCNHFTCDNCCVYHTSISIISIVPNTMRSNLIHGSRLSSNNTKVDCCISSCLFLEYSCARCSYCIAYFFSSDGSGHDVVCSLVSCKRVRWIGSPATISYNRIYIHSR